MEQKDYLLREIEKIGLLLRKLINSLREKPENIALSSVNAIEATSEQLLNELEFDLMHFLTLDKSELVDYLTKFTGINAGNMELLADAIFQVGLNSDADIKRKCFEKSLQLYEYCNLTDKTFSFEREDKIDTIKDALNQ